MRGVKQSGRFYSSYQLFTGPLCITMRSRYRAFFWNWGSMKRQQGLSLHFISFYQTSLNYGLGDNSDNEIGQISTKMKTIIVAIFQTITRRDYVKLYSYSHFCANRDVTYTVEVKLQNRDDHLQTMAGSLSDLCLYTWFWQKPRRDKKWQGNYFICYICKGAAVGGVRGYYDEDIL